MTLRRGALVRVLPTAPGSWRAWAGLEGIIIRKRRKDSIYDWDVDFGHYGEAPFRSDELIPTAPQPPLARDPEWPAQEC